MSRPFLFREIRREQIAYDLLGKDAVFSVLQYRRDRDREIPEHALGGSPGILRDCQHRLPDLVQIVL